MKSPQTDLDWHKKGTVDPKFQMGRLQTDERILLWLYILSFAFDFKGEEGGSLPQFIFAGVSIVTGGLFFLYGRLFRRLSKIPSSLKNTTTLWWLYLFSTTVTAIIGSVPFHQYGRVLFPFLLCGLSLLIMVKIQQLNVNPNEIIKPLVIASILSGGWTFFYEISVSDISIDSIRYQILSPSLPFLIGYAFVNLIILRRFDVVSYVTLAFSFIPIMLSITRSYLITLLFVGIGFVVLSMLSQGGKRVRRFGYIVIVCILTSLPASFAARKIRPDLFKIWEYRLLDNRVSAGLDISILTRLAETTSQWNLLTNNPLSFLFGRGFGSEYFWDQRYFSHLSPVYCLSYLENLSPWHAGHSMWMYSLYSGGLLFGWVLPLVFLRAIHKSFGPARKIHLISNVSIKRLLPLPFFVLLAFFGQSITSNPFGQRFSGLILGLVIGCAFLLSDHLSTKTTHSSQLMSKALHP